MLLYCRYINDETSLLDGSNVLMRDISFVVGIVNRIGLDGNSAYQIAVKNGYVGTEQQWLESLNGTNGTTPKKGIDYDDGVDGKSAYELAVIGGYVGTVEQFSAEVAAIANNSERLETVETEIFQLLTNKADTTYVNESIQSAIIDSWEGSY